MYRVYKRNLWMTALWEAVALTCKLIHVHMLVNYYDKTHRNGIHQSRSLREDLILYCYIRTPTERRTHSI